MPLIRYAVLIFTAASLFLSGCAVQWHNIIDEDDDIDLLLYSGAIPPAAQPAYSASKNIESEPNCQGPVPAFRRVGTRHDGVRTGQV